MDQEPHRVQVGRAVQLAAGGDVTIVAAWPYPVLMSLQARERLAVAGVQARVLDMHTIKPLDTEALLRAAQETAGIVTVEDHLVIGGLGAAVCETVAAARPCPVRRVGVPDRFSDLVGDEVSLLAAAGVTSERIAAQASQMLGARPGQAES
jgi:transketolase